MIMAFENDAIAGSLLYSIAAGAASHSDSSICSPVSSSSMSSPIGMSASSTSMSSPSAPAGRVAARLERLDRPGHEVAEHVLGDLEAALQLRDGLGRGLEHHDVVRALAVAVDGIREPAAAPGGDLDDLPALGDDVARGAVDDRGGPLIRRIRPEDEHEFIAAHGLLYSFQWDLPQLTACRRGAERTAEG